MLLRIAIPIQQPRMRFFYADGKPLVGGKVYSYKVGTESFKPTFRNAYKTALNQNPVVLDDSGSALIYMTGSHFLKVFEKFGSFIESRYLPMTEMRTYFYDKLGKPLKHGKVETYDVSSTIKKASYTESDKSILNTNPVILDENGSAIICMVGSYRLRVYDSKNVFLGDQDFWREPAFALTSRPYPFYFIENVAVGFGVCESLYRPDPVLVSVKIPALDNVSVSMAVHDVIVTHPQKIELAENLSTQLVMHDVVSRQLLKFGTQENVGVSLSVHDVVSKPRIKTNVDEAIGISLSINDVIREKI